MSRPPEVPDVTECSEEVESKVLEATNGVDYGPAFVNRVLRFFVENSYPFFSGQTCFFVLGSYDTYPIRRLQFVETELNARTRTYAFLLCDLLDPSQFETGETENGASEASTDDEHTEGAGDSPGDPPETHCKFYLLASYADYLVPVFEGRHAGPSVELGEIRNNFFEKTHAFRRNYEGLNPDELNNGVDPTNPYSQPQEDVLGLFDSVDRLYDWTDKAGLTREVDKLPNR